MKTFGEALQWGRYRLASPNEARVLLAWAIQCTKEDTLLQDKAHLSQNAWRRFSKAIHKRKNGMPVARITGIKEFWSQCFGLNAHTLIPRPDSECLVEKGLEVLHSSDASDGPPRILDLGTGSGCLLLSLLAHHEHAIGVGIDKSVQALAQAEKNTPPRLRKRCTFQESDWYAGLSPHQTFHLIIGNPPYIGMQEYAMLSPEVSIYDPIDALVGGIKGDELYPKIIREARMHLTLKGTLLLEISATQGKNVMSLFQKNGFQNIHIGKDLAQRDRFVVGWI